MRRRRWLLVLSVVATVAVAVLGVGAKTLLPPWIRVRIERAGSEALGREMRIARFELALSRTLVAEGVTLANAAWGSEPVMVRAGRVTASVDLLSLWSSPVRIRSLEIEDVRILVEDGPDGSGNWELGRSREPAPPLPGEPAGSPAVFDHIAIRNLELTRRVRPDAPLHRFAISRLESRLEPETGLLEVDATGHYDDAPWDLAGHLGRFDRLYELRDVAPEVTGHIGNVTLSFRGSVRDPLALGAPDFELGFEGPDIAEALATVGLRSSLSGPFRLQGRASSSERGVDLDLAAELSGVTLAAKGRVGALLTPDAAEATLEAAGPDAAVVGAWTGIEGLPSRPFTVTTRLRRDGPRIAIDVATMRVGEILAEVSGAIGEPPRYVGTDLKVTGSGPDLAGLSELTRLDLPPGPFKVSGRFLRRENGLAVEGVIVHVKDDVVAVGGAIGEPPRCESLDLTVSSASGPDLSRFSGIARVELPREPFTVRGRVTRHGAAVALEGIEGRLHDDDFTVDGIIAVSARLEGTNLNGRAAGPDVTMAASLLGLHGIPPESYEVSGRVLFTPEGYRLEGVEARVGELAATGSGSLGRHPTEDGTALETSLRGSALSDLAAWGGPVGLPSEPFTASGTLRINGDTYRVEHVAIGAGDDRAVLNGTLGRLPDLSSLDAEFDVSGPNLRDLARFAPAAGSEPPRRLPAEPYEASGRVRRMPAGWELHGARASVGNAEVRLEGLVGAGEKLLGTDLRFEARAPDTSLPASLAGVTFPEGPLDLRGRVELGPSGIRLDGLVASVGDARADVSGMLGQPPEYEGTGVTVRLAGPDMASFLGPITGLTELPPEPFDASARVEGSLNEFRATRLAAVLAGSDLAGSVSVRRVDRPFVVADLRSEHLDLTRFRAKPPDDPEATSGTPTPGTAPAAARARAAPGARLLPDDPLPFDRLKPLDGEIRLTAAELVLPWNVSHDVIVAADLKDGALRASRLEGTNPSGGRLTATLSLEPADGGYHLEVAGDIAGGIVDFSQPGQAPEWTPPVDVEFELDGVGASLHALAARSNGHALVTWGAGRVPSNLAGFVTSDVLQNLMDALNPFRKSSSETTFECGVVALTIENGKLVASPIAATTDKIIMLGHGRIDLDTERLDLVWTLKPRTGVGITGSSIANSYVRLGGTLSSPSLETKPLEALASTSAAFLTSGMSLLLRGLYDRITAERKVCVNALKVARDRAEKRERRNRP